jgi:MFS family permease
MFLLPAGVAMALASPVCGHLSDRLPAPTMLAVGLSIFAASCLLMSNLDPHMDMTLLLGQVVLGRIGLAVIFPPIYALSLYRQPPELLAQASGLVNALRQLGGAIGTALILWALQVRHSTWLAALRVDDATVVAPVDARIVQSLRAAAHVLAYDDLFRFMGMVFLACVPLALLLHLRRSER